MEEATLHSDDNCTKASEDADRNGHERPNAESDDIRCTVNLPRSIARACRLSTRRRRALRTCSLGRHRH